MRSAVILLLLAVVVATAFAVDDQTNDQSSLAADQAFVAEHLASLEGMDAHVQNLDHIESIVRRRCGSNWRWRRWQFGNFCRRMMPRIEAARSKVNELKTVSAAAIDALEQHAAKTNPNFHPSPRDADLVIHIKAGAASSVAAPENADDEADPEVLQARSDVFAAVQRLKLMRDHISELTSDVDLAAGDAHREDVARTKLAAARKEARAALQHVRVLRRAVLSKAHSAIERLRQYVKGCTDKNSRQCRTLRRSLRATLRQSRQARRSMAKAALKNLDRLKDIINSCEPGSTDMYCTSARTLLRVASQRVLETQHERLGSAQSDYDEADKQVAVCVTDEQCTKANKVLSAARRELNKARLAYMQAISQHMGRLASRLERCRTANKVSCNSLATELSDHAEHLEAQRRAALRAAAAAEKRVLLALKSCKGKCQKLNVRLVRLRILQSQLRRALLAAAAAKVDELSTAVKACNGFKGNEHCDLMRANLKRAQVHLQRTQTAHRASVAARLAESKIAQLRDQVKVCLTQDQCMRLRRSLSTAQDAYSKARAAAEYAAAKNWLKAIRAQITHIEEQLLEATKDGWSAERVHTLKLRLNRAQAALQKATSSAVDASNRMLEVARAAAAKLQLQLKDTLKMFDGQMDQPTTQQIVKSLRERVKKANKQVDAAKEVANKAQQRLIKQRVADLARLRADYAVSQGELREHLLREIKHASLKLNKLLKKQPSEKGASPLTLDEGNELVAQITEESKNQHDANRRIAAVMARVRV